MFKKFAKLARAVGDFLFPSDAVIQKTIILNGVKLEPGTPEYKKADQEIEEAMKELTEKVRQMNEALKK